MAVLLTIILGIGLPAHAGTRGGHARRGAVRVRSEHTIVVRTPGVRRATLESPEPVSAVALQDIDADGDLDVLVSTPRTGLMVWHNVHGEFVLAAPPSTHPLRPSAEPGLKALVTSKLAAGPYEQRQDSALCNALRSAGLPTVVQFSAVVAGRVFVHNAGPESGRGPPTHS